MLLRVFEVIFAVTVTVIFFMIIWATWSDILHKEDENNDSEI